MEIYCCSNCGNEWEGLDLEKRKDVREKNGEPVVNCGKCGQYTGKVMGEATVREKETINAIV